MSGARGDIHQAASIKEMLENVKKIHQAVAKKIHERWYWSDDC